MAKEWIDVADTAVKIGLGAAITGFFTTIGLKSSHNNEKEKYALDHKIKLIEQIALDLEVYFDACGSFFERYHGVGYGRKIRGEENGSLNKELVDYIREEDNKLVTSWSKLRSALSKLELLGGRLVIREVLSFDEGVNKIRDKFVFESIFINYDELNGMIGELVKHRESAMDELSSLYEALFGDSESIFTKMGRPIIKYLVSLNKRL